MQVVCGCTLADAKSAANVAVVHGPFFSPKGKKAGEFALPFGHLSAGGIGCFVSGTLLYIHGYHNGE